MAISITKVIREINQTPCSEHDVHIVDGDVGMIMVECINCKQRWKAEEAVGGGTDIKKISDSYTLPKLAKSKEAIIKEPVSPRDDTKNPLLDKLKSK